MLELKSYLTQYNNLAGLYDNLQFRVCLTFWKKNNPLMTKESFFASFKLTKQQDVIYYFAKHMQFIFFIETNLAFHIVFACEYINDWSKVLQFLEIGFQDDSKHFKFISCFYFFMEDYVFSQQQEILIIFLGGSHLPVYSLFLYRFKMYLTSNQVIHSIISFSFLRDFSQYVFELIETSHYSDQFFNTFLIYCLTPHVSYYFNGLSSFMDSICLTNYNATIVGCASSLSFFYSYWDHNNLLHWADTTMRLPELTKKFWNCFFVIDLNLISYSCNSKIIKFFYDIIANRFFSIFGLQFGFFYWSLENQFYGWLAVSDAFCQITWTNDFIKEFFFIDILENCSLDKFLNHYCSSDSDNIPVNRFYVAIYDADNWVLYWELYERIRDSLNFQKNTLIDSTSLDLSISDITKLWLKEDSIMNIEHKYVNYYLQHLKPQEKQEGELLTPWLIAPPERMKFV